jgi:hypothetical protein
MFKPDSTVDFAEQYFRKVQSRYHVINTDFSYVSACNYNRKSFIYCHLEASKGFTADYQITATDFFQIIEILTFNFPRSIVMDASLCIDPISLNSVSEGGDGNSSNQNQNSSSIVKYWFQQLSSSVHFYILYEEWMRGVEEFFRDECQGEVSIYRLKTLFTEVTSLPFPPPIPLSAISLTLL